MIKETPETPILINYKQTDRRTDKVDDPIIFATHLGLLVLNYKC